MEVIRPARKWNVVKDGDMFGISFEGNVIYPSIVDGNIVYDNCKIPRYVKHRFRKAVFKKS